MKKKNYYTPEIKFHQLKAKAAMLAGSNEEVGGDQGGEWAAKGGLTLSFDEDEE